ncbi:MAG: FliA/WhiG family RNA polymerase sigma factor [Oscillospiraceae bacterium]|nr:FliA/WhiG family RNA polymerase sigma factor [Oscillospiraceae bacterium]
MTQAELQSKNFAVDDPDELMRQYKETGSLELRNQLVMHYSYIAKTVAVKMSSTFHKYASVEEMVNHGAIALIDSLERYDPSQGVKFPTFAFTKVRGAIIDYVRKQDWLPRRVRQMDILITKAESQLTNELGRTPTREEMAKRLGMSLSKYDKCVFEMSGESIYSFEALLDAPVQMNLFKTNPGPEEKMDEQELRQELAKAIDGLNEQERTVLSLYYYENLTMREIGQVMGVSEQRIGQINRKLIKKLKDQLSDYVKG